MSFYADKAELDLSAKRVAKMGEKFQKGFYDDEVTNNTHFLFAQFYRHFAKQVNKETDTKLFNCTEGGIYLEGLIIFRLRALSITKSKDRWRILVSIIYSKALLEMRKNTLKIKQS